jgi:autotransporter-associated beta strand protein
MKHTLCEHLRSISRALTGGESFVHHSVIRRAGTPGFIVMAALVSSVAVAVAETDLPHPLFTWSLNPADAQWSNSANWMPTGVPDDQSERAAFGSSAITTVTPNFEEVHSVEFNPGASQYNITGGLLFNGGGVINNSGIMQTFTGSYFFEKGATVSGLVTFTDGVFSFFRTESSGTGCSAGSGTYVNPAAVGFSTRSTAGEATFIGNSHTISFAKADAGSATFFNNGAASFGADGGLIKFRKSSAASSTIINNGGAVFGGHGARCTFHKSSAGSATIIANGGAGPGSGATILFSEDTSGDTARIEVFGNGNFDMSRPKAAPNSIGSLEGNGLVFLGGGNLSIGSNNLNTNFAGVISDDGGVQQGSGGSITKNGTGILTFSSANTYTGGTTIAGGSLLVNNSTGSGTGSGDIEDESGTLGGAGIVAGAVTIGSGSSSGAILSPGASADSVGLFTIQGALTYDSDGICEVEVDSTNASADKIVANGVTINSAAQFSLADLGSSTLSAGPSFTIISNTAATPIAGTFGNLPDGGTIVVGSNNFQANYEGADGNDLTLTVVP